MEQPGAGARGGASVMEPRIQYARASDGVNVAYWTFGEGGTRRPYLDCGAALGGLDDRLQLNAIR